MKAIVCILFLMPCLLFGVGSTEAEPIEPHRLYYSNFRDGNLPGTGLVVSENPDGSAISTDKAAAFLAHDSSLGFYFDQNDLKNPILRCRLKHSGNFLVLLGGRRDAHFEFTVDSLFLNERKAASISVKENTWIDFAIELRPDLYIITYDKETIEIKRNFMEAVHILQLVSLGSVYVDEIAIETLDAYYSFGPDVMDAGSYDFVTSYKGNFSDKENWTTKSRFDKQGNTDGFFPISNVTSGHTHVLRSNFLKHPDSSIECEFETLDMGSRIILGEEAGIAGHGRILVLMNSWQFSELLLVDVFDFKEKVIARQIIPADHPLHQPGTKKLFIRRYKNSLEYGVNEYLFFSMPQSVRNGRIIAGACDNFSKVIFKSVLIDTNNSLRDSVLYTSVKKQDERTYPQPPDHKVFFKPLVKFDYSNHVSTINPSIDKEGNFSINFNMKNQGGSWAGFAVPLEYDISEFGGIRFNSSSESNPNLYARIFFRYIKDHVEHRIQTNFVVGENVILPFNDQTFVTNSADQKFSDFDFSRIEEMAIELFNLNEKGDLSIRDWELLPRGAASRFDQALLVQGFEPLKTFLFEAGIGGSEEILSNGGARGSENYVRLARQGSEYNINSALDISEYDGVELFLKGENKPNKRGIPLAHTFVSEQEGRQVAFWGNDEFHGFDVPVNSEWIQWRFPKGTVSGVQSSPYSDGRFGTYPTNSINVSITDSLSFLDLDEIRLYTSERFRSSEDSGRIKVAISDPVPIRNASAENAGFISSVVSANLGMVKGMDIVYDDSASFNLDMSYEEISDSLKIQTKVVNAFSQKVEQEISVTVPSGLDIFTALDIFSSRLIAILVEDATSDIYYEKGTQGSLFEDKLQMSKGYLHSFGEKVQFSDKGVLLEKDSLLLTDPYFENLKQIQFDVIDGAPHFILLFDYLGDNVTNRHDFEDIADGTTVTISFLEGEIEVRYNGASHRRAIRDIPMGRIGFQCLDGRVVLANLKVLFD